MTHQFLFNLYSLSKLSTNLLTKATVQFRIGLVGMYWNTVIDLLKNIALLFKLKDKKRFQPEVIYLNKMMIMNHD